MKDSSLKPDARHFDFNRLIGDCVVKSVDGIFLVDWERDSPDADLLHHDGFHIGLEVVRPIDQQYLDAQRGFKAAIEQVRQELAAQNVCGHVSLSFELREMRLETAAHRAWLREVPARIVKLVSARGPGTIEKALLQANGITRLASIEWNPDTETSVGWGWRTITKRGATLVEICLAKKHERLAYYRDQNGEHFREYWLALVGWGPGTVEDGGFSMLLSGNYETAYDRVFLIPYDSKGAYVAARDVTPAGTARMRSPSSTESG